SDPTRLDGIMLLAFAFASLMLPFLILRTLMNGTTEMKAIVSLLLLFSGVMVIISSSIEFLDYFPNNHAYVLPAAGVVALIYIFYIPAIMGGMEWVINQLERIFKWMLSQTPIMGRSEKLRRESVWITTLSLALKSGVSTHEAVDFASRVSRLISRKRSAKIISMAESGHPIGYSCLKSRGLPEKMSSKLVLYDGRDNYVESLGYLAEEITYENYERQGRIEALFEVTALVAIGLIVFFAAWGVYSFFNSIATMKL
ncbi:MAG: type II secretion system F family protein, partial [Candidatus Sumerlaeia bacterium]|nr:type II secretion system F family protein [Candidatus Sumerlaeia bacterium]